MMLETGSELRDDGLAWYDPSAMGIDIACAAPTTWAECMAEWRVVRADWHGADKAAKLAIVHSNFSRRCLPAHRRC